MHTLSMKKQYRAVTSIDFRTLALATDHRKSQNNVIVIVRFDSSDFRSWTHLRTINGRTGSFPRLRLLSRTLFKVTAWFNRKKAGRKINNNNKKKKKMNKKRIAEITDLGCFLLFSWFSPYLASYKYHVTFLFSSTTVQIGLILMLQVPYSMCVTNSGYLVVSDSENKALLCLDQTGQTHFLFQPPK